MGKWNVFCLFSFQTHTTFLYKRNVVEYHIYFIWKNLNIWASASCWKCKKGGYFCWFTSYYICFFSHQYDCLLSIYDLYLEHGNVGGGYTCLAMAALKGILKKPREFFTREFGKRFQSGMDAREQDTVGYIGFCFPRLKIWKNVSNVTLTKVRQVTHFAFKCYFYFV